MAKRGVTAVGQLGERVCYPEELLQTFPMPVLTAALSTQQVPVVEDIDKEQLGDPYANAEYAKEIFDYMREREVGDE